MQRANYVRSTLWHTAYCEVYDTNTRTQQWSASHIQQASLAGSPQLVHQASQPVKLVRRLPQVLQESVHAVARHLAGEHPHRGPGGTQVGREDLPCGEDGAHEGGARRGGGLEGGAGALEVLRHGVLQQLQAGIKANAEGGQSSMRHHLLCLAG
jgi:hypothetical protein